jgi:hypothetical protein
MNLLHSTVASLKSDTISADLSDHLKPLHDNYASIVYTREVLMENDKMKTLDEQAAAENPKRQR